MFKTALKVVTFAVAFAGVGTPSFGQGAPNPQVDRGRYLVKIQGCNDCHTAGYSESNGQTPEAQWLIGTNVGFKGPWGTSYPANIRNIVAGKTEDQWVQYAKTLKALPPMPWFNLNAVNDDDLRAMYAFIKSLGDSNNRVPEDLPPGQNPTTPYINFVPVNP